MTPRVSVIISTYIRPERLETAIASVQRQTFADWELIVVEDGMTAELSTMIDALRAADNRIRYLALPMRSGSHPAPKNLGIKEARAELVAFLDDDNTYRPDHLAALYQTMRSNSILDVVYGDRWAIDESGRYPPQIGTHAEQFSADLLMRQNFIDTSDVLVKRSALLYVGGFDERYRKFVDWNLWVRLAKAGFRFRRVPRILTDYYLHDDAKSARPEDERAPQTPAWTSYDLEIRLPFLGPLEPPRVAVVCATSISLDRNNDVCRGLEQTAGYPFDLYHGERGTIILPSLIDRYDVIGRVAADAVFLTPGWLAAIVEVWKRNHLLAMSPALHNDNGGGADSTRGADGQINGEPVRLTSTASGICIFADRRAWHEFRCESSAPVTGEQDNALSGHLRQRGYYPATLPNHAVRRHAGAESVPPAAGLTEG